MDTRRQAAFMHNSARRDDMTPVTKMLDADPNLLNATTDRGETLLHRMVRWDIPAYVSMLLERNIDIEAKDWQGNTALNIAVHEIRADKNPHVQEIIRLLIANGASVFEPGRNAKVPICTIMFRHQADLVRLAFTRNPQLVNTGVCDLSHVPQKHWPGLDWIVPGPRKLPCPLLAHAIWYRDVEIVQVLLDCGADPNEYVDQDGVLLNMDALFHCPTAARLLIEAGALVQGRKENSWNSLHSAAINDETGELTTVLLKCGVDVEAPSFDAQRPLHTAVLYKRIESAKAMLRAGANIDASNVSGTTPLMIAVGYGWEEGVSFLIAEGANLSQADQDGNTALHYSIAGPYTDISRMLVQAGSDVDKENDLGVTPVSIGLAGWDQQLSDCLMRHSKRYYVPEGVTVTYEQRSQLLEYAISANPHGLSRQDYVIPRRVK